MTGPNHLVGGVVYTGVFCSFWDINVFSKPWYLVAAMFFSLLPDIDHKQGILGRAFSFSYLPQWIERNYGHRTITHSLICYFCLAFFVWLSESFFSDTREFTAVFLFAYSSHLIFDMMTVSGVPLFFPFKKNPCVLPANPEYRLKVKDLKSESIVFVAFIGIGIFCYPLMVQGFWTSYNRSFGTLDHLFREYSMSKDLILVDYDYLSHGENRKGQGLLVHSEKSKAYLFEDEKVFEINDKMKIEEVLPSHTQQPREEKEVFFYQINQDSLSNLIGESIVISGEFQANKTIGYWSNEEYKNSNVVTLKFAYKPLLEVIEDTSHTSERNALEIKLIELKEKQRRLEIEHEIYDSLRNVLFDIESNMNRMSLSQRELEVQHIRELENKIENYTFSYESTEKLEKQIEHINQAIKSNEKTYFTGKLVLLDIMRN